MFRVFESLTDVFNFYKCRGGNPENYLSYRNDDESEWSNMDAVELFHRSMTSESKANPHPHS